MDLLVIFRLWKTWMKPQAAAQAIEEDRTHKFEFLLLPAEVRNMIYRYTLVEGEIRVTTTTTQPSLLQVNQQIRQEAILIYYQEKTFYWCISAFDATKHIAWCASSKERLDTKPSWKLSGPRNWNNLLYWLEAFYYGECNGPSMRKRQLQNARTGKTPATTRLFQLVVKMKNQQGLDWRMVKANLQLIHESFGVLDRKWELEKDAS